MHPNALLPLLATVVSFLFAVTVLDQYILRPRPYKAVWTVGLLLYGIGTFAQFWGAQQGWSPSVYKLWYLSGAICVAALLGMGTGYLFLPRRVAHILLAVLALGIGVAAVRISWTSSPLAIEPSGSILCNWSAPI